MSKEYCGALIPLWTLWLTSVWRWQPVGNRTTLAAFPAPSISCVSHSSSNSNFHTLTYCCATEANTNRRILLKNKSWFFPKEKGLQIPTSTAPEIQSVAAPRTSKCSIFHYLLTSWWIPMLFLFPSHCEYIQSHPQLCSWKCDVVSLSYLTPFPMDNKGILL